MLISFAVPSFLNRLLPFSFSLFFSSFLEELRSFRVVSSYHSFLCAYHIDPSAKKRKERKTFFDRFAR